MRRTNGQSSTGVMEKNVGATERALSLLSGSYLMYNALTKRTSIPKGLAAGYLLFRGATGYCPTYQALGQGTTQSKTNDINIKVNVKVNKPRNEVYDFWRKLDNLPLFMEHLESVTKLDNKKSEWKASVPGGLGTVTWKAEIVEDQQNERISWRSLPDSTIENSGSVQFRDAANSRTEVEAIISYRAPGGKPGELVGKLLNPVFERMVKEDVKNFKQYMESDKTLAGERQASGRINY